MSKRLRWVGSSREDLRKFSEKAREVAGFQLFQLEKGLNPDDFSPMPDVGNGACEIRVQIGEDFRIVYVAKWADAIYVLHVFQKKSRKTSPKDITLAKSRYKAAKEYSEAATKNQKSR